MRRHYLAAVVPVGFVAVVFWRVVACGDDDPALAAEVTYGERYFRSRAERVEKIRFDAVGREYFGAKTREFVRVMAHVAAYHYGYPAAGELFFEIIGQALRGGPYRVFVHAVGPDAHYAAHASGTEFEVFME